MGILGDSDAQQLAKYIRQLSNVGVPQNKKLIMVGEEENGDKRTFNHCPLFEFRVNRSTLEHLELYFLNLNGKVANC